MPVTYRTVDDLRAAIGSPATRDVIVLRDSIHQALVDQIRAYQAGMQKINDDPRLSIQARLDDVAALRERFAGEVDAIETRGKETIQRVRSAVAQATQEPQDVASQTLRELQISNGWTRAQLLIAGGQSLTQIAKSAGETGDKSLIAALRQYAGPYLASQNTSSRMVDAVMAALDTAETPLMSETQQVARDVRDELEVGSSNLTLAAQQTRGIVTGKSEWSHLQAWQQGKALQIDPAIPGVRR
jgi:hypothetical protein